MSMIERPFYKRKSSISIKANLQTPCCVAFVEDVCWSLWCGANDDLYELGLWEWLSHSLCEQVLSISHGRITWEIVMVTYKVFCTYLKAPFSIFASYGLRFQNSFYNPVKPSSDKPLIFNSANSMFYWQGQRQCSGSDICCWQQVAHENGSLHAGQAGRESVLPAICHQQ